MPVYKYSTIDTYYSVQAMDRGHRCEVKIEGDAIAVSYKTEGRYVVYEGQQIGSGHFSLDWREPSGGRATLHQVPNENTLEGWWMENGEEGMWRIDLEE
jgi:hypothetical protein